MKRLLLTTSIAVLLLTSGAAMARDHGKDKHDRYDDDRYGYNDRRDRDDDDRRYDDRRYDDRRHDNGRHLGQVKQGYRRGMRAPVVYLQPRYYVNDYRHYRLSAPPRGYRWVRPANDHYLLVEVATGLISQALGY